MRILPHPHALWRLAPAMENPQHPPGQHQTMHTTPYLLPPGDEAMRAVCGPHLPACLTSGLISSQTPRRWTNPSLMGNSYFSPRPMREGAGGATACQEGNTSLSVRQDQKLRQKTQDPRVFPFCNRKLLGAEGLPLPLLPPGSHPCLLCAVASLLTAIQSIFLGGMMTYSLL